MKVCWSAPWAMCLLVIAHACLAQECVMPGQSFACVGSDCAMVAGLTEGQQADILPEMNRVRIRAVSTSTFVESSYGELYGVVIEPAEPMFVRGHASVTYSGFLTGHHGGSQNFGRIDIRAVIRNLDSGDLVASDRIIEGENSGDVGGGGPSAFSNFFTGPPARRDVPFESDEGVLLEAGISYGIGIGVRAEADGNAIDPGESDFFTGGNGVLLDLVELITWPDASQPGWQDSDGDGLSDVWETDGVRDCDGNVLLALHDFGADPDHKDLFVELDWMEGREPSRRAIQTVKDAFALAPVGAGGVDNPDGDPGINLWVDTGGLTDDSGNLIGDDFGGGNEIDEADIPDPSGQFIPPHGLGAAGLDYDIDIDDNQLRDFYEVKNRNFDLVRTRIFRYSISARDRNEEGNDYPGGQGELSGDDTILFSTLPVVLIHELGHNLSLNHGGDEGLNCKPNYVSIMNYALVGGIPRRSLDTMAQDVDNDGVDDARILDFSPPRLTATTRGSAPLFGVDDNLDESALSEFRELDEIDTQNATRFFDPNGNGRDLDLDSAPDWDGGGNSGASVSVNVNFSEDVPGCGGNDEQQMSQLSGHDDWSAITLPVIIDGIAEELADNETDITPVPEEPDPDEDQIRDIEALFNTLDLSVEKSVVPELVMAGQTTTYEIAVTNNGPNAALEAIIEDRLPEFVTPVDLPETCEETSPGVVECRMDVIAEGATSVVTLSGRVAPRLPCTDMDTVTLVNEVEARNGGWSDTVSSNNTATAQSEALCLRYEYAAKFVCGARDDPDSLLALPGRYATIVNIHNPQSRSQPFFKKLALTFPPAEQAAGDIHAIGIDELGYDEALKVDCDDIQRRLFDGALPGGFIEGYLVVQSPRTLDVDAFYSAGTQDGVRSIHIEEIAVRDLRTDISIEKTSQTFLIPLGPGPDALAQFRLAATLYTVTVENQGAVHAEALRIDDVVALSLAGQVVGATVVLNDPFELPPGASLGPVETAASPPTSSFRVDLPDLAPASSMQIRFWALSLVYLSNPNDPLAAAVLTNRADVSSQGPDTTLVDNTVSTQDNLLQ